MRPGEHLEDGEGKGKKKQQHHQALRAARCARSGAGAARGGAVRGGGLRGGSERGAARSHCGAAAHRGSRRRERHLELNRGARGLDLTRVGSRLSSSRSTARDAEKIRKVRGAGSSRQPVRRAGGAQKHAAVLRSKVGIAAP